MALMTYRKRLGFSVPLGFFLLLAVTAVMPAVDTSASTTEQHQLGTKYSPLTGINRENVHQLEPAWEYHTGDSPTSDQSVAFIAFEDEPSLIAGNLVVCSITRRLIALDPQTGAERWVYDPRDPDLGVKKCRGISSWTDRGVAQSADCGTRIFLATADLRLIAIDARDGKPCREFGDGGVVRMSPSKPTLYPGEVLAASPPAVVNDVVVVGSFVADNQRVDAPSGRVLAFSARTGEQVWEFDPLPRDPTDPAAASWEKGTAEGYGGGNVWASMAVDQSLDLVYLPTSTPSGDFYGGGRAGNNHYADSVVALRGATGEVAWHFQIVHHNIWDYDTPSQPLLIDYPHGGALVPALVQNTKTGLIYVLNRETGKPLVPVEERPVPQAGKVQGEELSPTQPFTVGMPTLAPQDFSLDDMWGFTPIDRWLCKDKFADRLFGPIYTPPSEKGTVVSPAVAGGPNWGGGAYDPESHIMVVPSNRVPTIVTLTPRENVQLDEGPSIEGRAAMTFPVAGSPYVPTVEPLLSPLGAPCSEPPWAALTAVDLVKREIVWEVPLGSLEKLLPLPIPWELGTPGAGGPLITAGGLVFIGYTLDDSFRAFDLLTGEVIWKTDLPAPGTSIPVTYEAGGEQYVVIPAGGHSMYGTTMSDSVMAYKIRH